MSAAWGEMSRRGLQHLAELGHPVPGIKAAVPPVLLPCPGALPQFAQQGRGKVRFRYLRRQQAQHVIAGHLRHGIALDAGPDRHHGRRCGRMG